MRISDCGSDVCSSDRAMRVDLAEDDLAFLEAVANTLAGVIDSHHALDELRFNALHDDLTELPNRALVLDRLQLALEQTATSGCQVAVLMCDVRSEEHTSELQSLMRISYAVFCLKKKHTCTYSPQY